MDARKPSKVEERDGGWTTLSPYDVDATLASGPDGRTGASASTEYIFDSSAGEGVTLYILDGEPFDFTYPVSLNCLDHHFFITNCSVRNLTTSKLLTASLLTTNQDRPAGHPHVKILMSVTER